jgi:hypothetical protein
LKLITSLETNWLGTAQGLYRGMQKSSSTTKDVRGVSSRFPYLSTEYSISQEWCITAGGYARSWKGPHTVSLYNALTAKMVVSIWGRRRATGNG